jgi:transposase InsO family protein
MLVHPGGFPNRRWPLLEIGRSSTASEGPARNPHDRKLLLDLRAPDPGLYFHSDRGSQYSSQAVRKPLSVIGANLSMSAQGNCYDNAKAEAFFSTLKTECFPPDQLFGSKALARREIFEYIEVYYNNRRLHSALGYQTPRQFEVGYSERKNDFFEGKVSATLFQNA